MRRSDVWSLSDMAEWRDSFIAMIEEIHPYYDLVHKLMLPYRPVIQEDDTSILDAIISSHKGHECDFIELMASKFRKKYNFVRAFHASRPINIEDILEKGLLVFSIDDYHRMAQSIFPNDNYPSIKKEEVRCAVEKTAKEGCGRVNKLYFYATEYYNKCNHYSKFGSEFMLVVASNLHVKKEYLRNSKDEGYPSLFLCNVPIENICDKLLFSCLRVAIYYLFNPSLEDAAPLKNKDISIFIECGLSSSNIVGHHPFP